MGNYGGTLVGSPSVTTNKFGASKAIDYGSANTSKYTTVASDLIGDALNAFTIIAMVKIETSGYTHVIYSESISSNTVYPYWSFGITTVDPQIRLSSRSNTNTEWGPYASVSIALSEWHIVAVSHAASSTT